MSANPRRHQKKVERRSAKRKQKRHQTAKTQAAGLAGQLTAAARHPVLHRWIMENLWTNGLGHVVLSRELPDGRVAVASFLIDRFCLGVKDAHSEIMGRFSYESKYVRDMKSQFVVHDVSPEAVRKLVEAAAAYAKELGFLPHPDYQRAKLLFGDIDASQCLEEFEFGKDGMPLFMAGPYDSPARCKRIMEQLERKCGQGNYRYIVPIGTGPDMAFTLEEDEDGDELWEEDDEAEE